MNLHFYPLLLHIQIQYPAKNTCQIMQTESKNIFLKPVSKAIIDILLVIGLILSIISGRTANYLWGSFHCIVSMIWYGLMLIHIWQHWKMTKAMFKWKVIKKNKITFITVIVFILMSLNIIVFIFEVNNQLAHIHHIISHIFWKIMIIHTIQKTKRFISLFKRK